MSTAWIIYTRTNMSKKGEKPEEIVRVLLLSINSRKQLPHILKPAPDRFTQLTFNNGGLK